jgi:hypothetical protein
MTMKTEQDLVEGQLVPIRRRLAQLCGARFRRRVSCATLLERNAPDVGAAAVTTARPADVAISADADQISLPQADHDGRSSRRAVGLAIHFDGDILQHGEFDGANKISAASTRTMMLFDGESESLGALSLVRTGTPQISPPIALIAGKL